MKRKNPVSKSGVTLKVKVEPRSSRSEVVGPYGEGIKVKLTSPPVEGRANAELVEVLAKAYGVSKKDIEIVSGQSSKNKIVRIAGIREDKKDPSTD